MKWGSYFWVRRESGYDVIRGPEAGLFPMFMCHTDTESAAASIVAALNICDGEGLTSEAIRERYSEELET